MTFKLFDLNGGSYEFIREETVYSNSDILKFDQLKESSYLVQMESGDCSKTIGGLQGIKISRKRQ
ncbi:hypothetical protein LVD17_18965 [Fulvivirga ulvae]|uniref:hypothetical protein n=1 Tax=Fulvivirga ulvae TaxID=2904245 RepID=UPI001F1796AB|nr:hypothetical protein [Fulvivirga ulvae]UII30375.1 hypothetical protein LVD17_18965 [Fulvivirga ulvae]